MATLKFGDFEFTGTAAECIAMVTEMRGSAAHRAPTIPPASLPQPVKTPGAISIGGAWPQPQAQTPFSTGISNKLPKRAGPDEAQTIAFLKAVADHTASGGLTGDELAPILMLTHPKGIGSRTAVLNKAIEALGYDVEQVYSKNRGKDGQRRWTAGPKMREALDALNLLARKGDN